MHVARTGHASCPHNAAAPPAAVGRLTYWKDGGEVEVTESDLPEEQALWESVTTAPLWDLVQAKQGVLLAAALDERGRPLCAAVSVPFREQLQLRR
jgi:hypothetical protein